MKDLQNVEFKVTMSSREIAELTGKLLKHIHRDIENMLSELGTTDGPNLDHVSDSLHDSNLSHVSDDLHYEIERNEKGYIHEYRLSRFLCEVLITGYSVRLRAKVIERLHELENRTVEPLFPTIDDLNKHYLEVKTKKEAASLSGKTLSQWRKESKRLKEKSDDLIKKVQISIEF